MGQKSFSMMEAVELWNSKPGVARRALRLAPVLALAAFAPLLSAQDSDSQFRDWWPKFKAAVARKDANTAAEGIRFPLDWENGPIRRIETKDDFIRQFDKYFTAEIRKEIARRKPLRLYNGNYMIAWHARGNEYSLLFTPAERGYALLALGEGPP